MKKTVERTGHIYYLFGVLIRTKERIQSVSAAHITGTLIQRFKNAVHCILYIFIHPLQLHNRISTRSLYVFFHGLPVDLNKFWLRVLLTISCSHLWPCTGWLCPQCIRCKDNISQIIYLFV